jgi:hypothetical protein
LIGRTCGGLAAAEKAAAAAEKTAALDAERRHAELTPEFEIACTAEHNGISDQGELTVTLTGALVRMLSPEAIWV